VWSGTKYRRRNAAEFGGGGGIGPSSGVIGGNTIYNGGGVRVNTQPSKNNLKKLLPLVAIVVAVVLVIVLICRLIAGTPKGVVKDYVKALSKQDAEAFIDLCPDEFVENLLDDYDISERNLEKTIEVCLDEDLEGYEDAKLKKFKDKEKADDDDLDDVNDYLDLDKDVKKGYEYEIKIEYDDGDSGTLVVDAFKYRGKWYCYNACSLVKYCAMNSEY